MIRVGWLALALLLVSSTADSAPKRTAKTTAQTPAPKSLLQDLELFSLEAPHSPIGFAVPWMGLSKVRGSFDDCFGSIVIDSKDLTRSSVSIVARTASLRTGNTQR